MKVSEFFSYFQRQVTSWTFMILFYLKKASPACSSCLPSSGNQPPAFLPGIFIMASGSLCELRPDSAGTGNSSGEFLWIFHGPVPGHFSNGFTAFYNYFKTGSGGGGVHRSEDGGPGGPADGLCAAPARARRQSRFQSRKARKTPGHVPVIRGLKIHTLLGIYPRKYGKFSTFLIFAKSYFREKLQ